MATFNVTTDTFIPADAAATGTVDTFGASFITSTADQVKVGDYITDSTQKESRRVEWVERDGVSGLLNSAFTSDLSTTALKVIDKEDCKIIAIGIAADQGVDTEVDGVTITSTTSDNSRFLADRQGSLGYNFVKPIYVEGSTTGACTVTVTNYGNQK